MYQGKLIIAETGHSTSARLRDLFKRFDKAKTEGLGI